MGLMSLMEKIRTFVAIPIPVEIRRELAEVENDLMPARAGVKWVAEGNFHVTLKFLGHVEQERLEAIARGVEAAVAGTGSFEVELANVGAFPNISRPSVVWVGVTKGAQEMISLANRVDAEMARNGFERETRPFSAHITLGRVKSPKNRGGPPENLDKLRELIERHQNREVGSFGVEQVSIMKSDLQRSGPIYTAVSDFRLSRESGIPSAGGTD